MRCGNLNNFEMVLNDKIVILYFDMTIRAHHVVNLL